MHYFLYFLLPFSLSLILTPIIRFIAIKNGMISFPRADRWNKHPTALLGGASIYLSCLITALFALGFNKVTLGLFIGATFLFIVGLVDDRFHLTPYVKLFAQIISGCIVIFLGLIAGLPLNPLLAVPLILLWIVGVTNSFNLLDNIDGLAAGIAAISALMLFFSSLIFSNNPLGIYSLILSGAALGFLPYNFNPAKIFMGDSGSMFLGFSLAIISISETTRNVSNLLIIILMPVLILSVPIFDTLFVMILRKLQGRKIFEGGKDHTSHRLVTLGLTQRKTVLLLYALSLVFGLIAISYSRLNAFVITIITFLAIIILLFFGLFLTEVTSYNNSELKNGKKINHLENGTILNTIFMYKRRIIEVLLDFIFICIAYYCAYFLRFEGSLLSSNLHLIEDSLAWIILLKMSVFFIFGLYRGVWRYVSISDLFTIFKVTTISSAVSVLFLTFSFRFKDYSRAVFFIDWLILLFLLCSSRISFRILGEFFSRIREKGKNILIFGAGDTGEMVIREIKRNRSLKLNPVGFIDDDAEKIGNKIQGVPVLGSREDISGLITDFKIEEIIIAMPSIGVKNLSEITGVCKYAGVPYRIVKGILDTEESIEFRQN